MGVLPRALEITFEVQRKRNNEKITWKKQSFPTFEMRFLSLFFSLKPLTFEDHNFLISHLF
jgi:hypothetical protein